MSLDFGVQRHHCSIKKKSNRIFSAIPYSFLIFIFFVALWPCSFRLFNFEIDFLSRAYATEIPPLKGYINDYANMIPPTIRTKLTNELREFERTDSTQIVILTIPSLEGLTIEDYSIKVAEAWKIGKKGRDNGIILIIANQERKIRIEVGRGLEGKLTDLMAGRIIDLVVKPRFKRGDFSGGLVAGIAALIDATKGEFKTDDDRPSRTIESFSPFFTFLLFGAVGLLILGNISPVLGGVAGAIGLPVTAYFVLEPSVFTLILLCILGLIMGIFLPFLFSGAGQGRGGMFFPRGGSFGSRGRGNDDFDSRGGFGGGGDFGGGGASGDW